MRKRGRKLSSEQKKEHCTLMVSSIFAFHYGKSSLFNSGPFWTVLNGRDHKPRNNPIPMKDPSLVDLLICGRITTAILS